MNHAPFGPDSLKDSYSDIFSPHQIGVFKELLTLLKTNDQFRESLIEEWSPAVSQNAGEFGLFILKLGLKEYKGDVAWLLYVFAHTSIVLLNGLTKASPESVRNVSSNLLEWPVMLSTSKNDVQNARSHLKKIGLGNKAVVDPETLGKRKTTARQWVYLAIRRIEIIRVLDPLKSLMMEENVTGFLKAILDGFLNFHGQDLIRDTNCTPEQSEEFVKQSVSLPPLSSQSVDAWFAVIKLHTMLLTEGKPEDNKDLQRIGLNRISRATPGSESSHIRDGIFKALKQALTSIARKS